MSGRRTGEIAEPRAKISLSLTQIIRRDRSPGRRPRSDCDAISDITYGHARGALNEIQCGPGRVDNDEDCSAWRVRASASGVNKGAVLKSAMACTVQADKISTISVITVAHASCNTRRESRSRA